MNCPTLQRDIVCSGTGPSFMSMLGVCRALNERGISPRGVACTSGSSIPFGLVYGAGLHWSNVYDKLMALKFSSTLALRPWSGGLYDTTGVGKQIDKWTGGLRMRQLFVPEFQLNATDVWAKQPFILSKATVPDMTLGQAIRMTITLPGLFAPIEYQGRWFVDGGVYENVMTSAFPDSDVHKLIFVEKDTRPEPHATTCIQCAAPKPSAVRTLYNSFSCLMDARDAIDLRNVPNSTIIPIPLRDSENLDPSKQEKEEMFQSGYKAATEALTRRS